MVNSRKITIEAGAEKEFSVLVASDIHLTDCDERDSDELNALSQKRKEVYPSGKEYLDEFLEIRKKTGDELFILGDMTDFISRANTDYIKKIRENNDFTFLAGNHDYRNMGGMKYDVPESREKNSDEINSLYDNDISFFSKVINGVNFVGLDDIYYRFTYEQIEKLRAEVNKGQPVILMLHIPFHEDSIYHTIVGPDRSYASIVNTPVEMMTDYSEKRFIQQIADEPTKEMYRFVTSCPGIKAVITGHLHRPFEVTLEGNLKQYSVSKGEYLHITVR